MVLDDDFEVAEHHALLQNKASIHNNVLAKRKVGEFIYVRYFVDKYLIK